MMEIFNAIFGERTPTCTFYGIWWISHLGDDFILFFSRLFTLILHYLIKLLIYGLFYCCFSVCCYISICSSNLYSWHMSSRILRLGVSMPVGYKGTMTKKKHLFITIRLVKITTLLWEIFPAMVIWLPTNSNKRRNLCTFFFIFPSYPIISFGELVFASLFIIFGPFWPKTLPKTTKKSIFDTFWHQEFLFCIFYSFFHFSC